MLSSRRGDARRRSRAHYGAARRSQRWPAAVERERDTSDVLALQSEIAGVVAEHVRASVAPDEARRLRAVRKVSPKAQELYMLGRYHTYRLNREGLNKSRDYLLEATRIEPGFALAYAALSEAYRHSEVWAGYGVGAFGKEMRAAAETALALDDSLAEAHFAVAEVLSTREWNWAAADAAFRRAIELNSSLSEALTGYAYHLQTLRRHDEAIAVVRRATALEPLSAYQLTQEGRVLFRARRYDEALLRYARALEIEPDYAAALTRASDVYLVLGRFSEAEAQIKRLQHLSGNFEWRQMAQLYARTGRAREARAAIDKVETESVSGLDLAYVLVALGDHDAALNRLEQAVRERTILPFALRDPRWDPIATSPRFAAILRSVNLQP